MKIAQVVIGPAGCGKMYEHLNDCKRDVVIVNLDPAADHFEYEPHIDIRNLITVNQVMENKELTLGPNGGLIYCMKYLINHIDWLMDQIDSSPDYILFDCPGQIELYSHLMEFEQFFDHLKLAGFRVCIVYLLDSQFMLDPCKYIGGVIWALSSMMMFELPHINVLTKIDLLGPSSKSKLENLVDQMNESKLDQAEMDISYRYMKLNQELFKLIDEYSMVSFMFLDYDEETCLEDLLITIDNATQYGEDEDVKEMDINV